MADYRELLRRAVAALPENNGAARRAVYEKARSALVGQLRAIDPPLPAREITQHRLQLEDCIREVEQEASEAVISLGRGETAPVAPAATTAEPAPTEPAEPPQQVKAEAETESVQAPEPKAVAEPASETTSKSKTDSTDTIEDIIAAAEATSREEPVDGAKGSAKDRKTVVEPALLDDGDEAPGPAELVEPVESPPTAKTGFRLFPSLASRNESPLTPVAPRSTASEPRGGQVRLAASKSGEAFATSPARIEPSLGNQAVARKRDPELEPETVGVIEDQPVEAALSSVREVEVEAAPKGANDTSEAEGAIERAIETLDRAARGEESSEHKADDLNAAKAAGAPDSGKPAAVEGDFVQTVPEPRSGSGLTIFLIVFALLLAGVSGAGYWAWREGYIDLEQMFGSSSAAVATAETAAPDTPEDIPTLDAEREEPQAEPEPQTGPGNTATETALAEPTTALQGIEGEERLTPEPEPAEPENAADEAISEDRLPADTDTALVDDPAASVDPAVLAGSQSLLLEAADDGRTGAVPFSGTVEWSEGTDELGMPTLVANADIPARNLGVEIIIRRNADPSLPASHLMEINFDVADTFVGGSISSLPGVLLKDEELVQGTPLVGASARVVGNSFLFALSASEEDLATNRALLSERKWMDLAVIYATGKRAIITLEKDDEAEQLFAEVFTEWQQAEAE
jgi:hypothetical protein